MEERYAVLLDLFKDEAVAKSLLSLSPEEASVVLKNDYGIAFTVEELIDIVNGIKDSVNDTSSDELDLNDLDQVAGGKKGSTAYNFGKAAGKAAPVVVVLVTVAVCTGW